MLVRGSGPKPMIPTNWAQVFKSFEFSYTTHMGSGLSHSNGDVVVIEFSLELKVSYSNPFRTYPTKLYFFIFFLYI